MKIQHIETVNRLEDVYQHTFVVDSSDSCHDNVERLLNSGSYNAKEVYLYFRVYQHFLIENGLDDDSDFIKVGDLINYVKDQIDEEDFNRIASFCQQAY